MEDERIVALFLDRSERAIAETNEKYGRLCHRIAQNILGSKADAEECVNDAYLGLWNSIPPERPVYFSAYLCKLVRNHSLKRLEQLSARKRSAMTEVPLEELESVIPDEELAPDVDAEELGKLINEFLRREKATARNIFLRKYMFFDSIHEIALHYGMNESTIKSTLRRTRGRLREYLKKEGVEL